MNPTLSRIASGAATATLVLCAVVVTGLVVRRELSPSTTNGPAGEARKDWLNFASEGQRIGPEGAKVALVVFSDFQCPACRMLEQRIATVRKNVETPFTVVFRHLPLEIHPVAQAAAEASECAGAQGRFEAMKNALFRNQRTLGTTEWKVIATEAAVPDLAAFERCRASTEMAPRVRRDIAAAESLRATGTPVVLINGRRYAGTPPQDQLESLIREALRRSQ